jgi:hypothetical protein
LLPVHAGCMLASVGSGWIDMCGVRFALDSRAA